MTRVEYRLAAARFFLRSLREQGLKQPEFDWMLEAFISIARTVRWLMRTEVHNSPLMDEWEQTYSPGPEVATLYRKVNDIRVRLTKVEPTRTKEVVELTLPPTPGLDDGLDESGVTEGGLFRLWTSPDGKQFVVESMDGRIAIPAKVRTQYQSLDQFPMEDALNVCERYLSQLEADYQAWRLFYSERMRSKA
ncbi:MAG TPA: hypothetical protein VJS12_04635 [Steroidobacteraceae bacterium]|nr:hypothetical protein [Steroidobacteraceae bacterium]